MTTAPPSFKWLCDLLPEDTFWHDELTPAIAQHIAIAAIKRAESAQPAAPQPVAVSEEPDLLQWAVQCWRNEVENRPLVNVHRRALDDTWRQVIRRLGGDPDELLGMLSHDQLCIMRDRLHPVESAQPKEAEKVCEWSEFGVLFETGCAARSLMSKRGAGPYCTHCGGKIIEVKNDA